jgi:RNA polymerase sigma-70 factor (ECF subfamily)
VYRRPDHRDEAANRENVVAFDLFQRGSPARVLSVVMAFPRLVRAPELPPDALAERTDDELMTLAQAGHQRPFEVLVNRHARHVVNLCSRFVNDAQLGRELAQDTWVMVWQRRASYRVEGGFVAWLVTVARNHCRNQMRQRKVAAAYQQRPREELLDSASQLDALLVDERRRRVRSMLSELSFPLREALLLRYAEELPYDQMTAIAGTGESTLRSRVHHALKILKQKLEKDS